MNIRLALPRKESGSNIRATRVPSGQYIHRSIGLTTFEDHRPPSSSVFASSPPPTTGCSRYGIRRFD